MEIKDQMNSIVKEGKEYLQIQSSLVQLQVKKLQQSFWPKALQAY